MIKVMRKVTETRSKKESKVSEIRIIIHNPSAGSQVQGIRTSNVKITNVTRMGVKENHFKKSLQPRNLNLIKIQTVKDTRGATVQMI